MIVRLTPEAKGDLVSIGLWISRDNQARADSFVDELEGACASLASRPSRFPVALHLDGDALRKRLYRGHLIFYRIVAKEVEVVRIIHGARDWMTLLRGTRIRS